MRHDNIRAAVFGSPLLPSLRRCRFGLFLLGATLLDVQRLNRARSATAVERTEIDRRAAAGRTPVAIPATSIFPTVSPRN